jgi:hypothetical protein
VAGVGDPKSPPDAAGVDDGKSPPVDAALVAPLAGGAVLPKSPVEEPVDEDPNNPPVDAAAGVEPKSPPDPDAAEDPNRPPPVDAGAPNSPVEGAACVAPPNRLGCCAADVWGADCAPLAGLPESTAPFIALAPSKADLNAWHSSAVPNFSASCSTTGPSSSSEQSWQVHTKDFSLPALGARLQ